MGVEKSFRYIFLAFLALGLSACASAKGEKAGSMYGEGGTMYFNINLVTSSNDVDTCHIPNALLSETGAIRLPLETKNIPVTCYKNQKPVAQRTLYPVVWKAKYKENRRNEAIGALVGGGVIGLLAHQSATPTNPEVNEVRQAYKLYPPYIAIVSDTIAAEDKRLLKSRIGAKYNSHLNQLSTECAKSESGANRTLCDSKLIQNFRKEELKYIETSITQIPSVGLEGLSDLIRQKLINEKQQQTEEAR